MQKDKIIEIIEDEMPDLSINFTQYLVPPSGIKWIIEHNGGKTETDIIEELLTVHLDPPINNFEVKEVQEPLSM